ncbi:hypothetical protein SELMODRAFT_428177 [Selaginella moellendorffii]|uniref:Uncharacterized protein n=1 Tax=Selaginella moellendorffii TaxID=88036 RepID=D8T202_SELML|nr:hypothetical protein SELMODRAFT_428177 [Selaginella moellendorffii]
MEFVEKHSKSWTEEDDRRLLERFAPKSIMLCALEALYICEKQQSEAWYDTDKSSGPADRGRRYQQSLKLLGVKEHCPSLTGRGTIFSYIQDHWSTAHILLICRHTEEDKVQTPQMSLIDVRSPHRYASDQTAEAPISSPQVLVLASLMLADQSKLTTPRRSSISIQIKDLLLQEDDSLVTTALYEP